MAKSQQPVVMDKLSSSAMRASIIWIWHVVSGMLRCGVGAGKKL